MITTLDCEDYDSAIKSLADTHKAKITDVEVFLSDLDLEEHYRNVSVRGDEYLTGLFQSQSGRPIYIWNAVFWFHLTRVPAATDLLMGFCPLD
jgi:hypothetical protein